MEVQEDQTVCPRCGSTQFREVDCGPDSFEDDITYTALVCCGCALWYDGWRDEWLEGVTCWQEAEDAEEFKGGLMPQPAKEAKDGNGM